MALNLEYPAILTLFGNHLIPGRTESRAMLGWFLENYFRLEEIEAQDAICDGSDDKGIDAIYVDKDRERIYVFQGKLFKGKKKSLGDPDLKEFFGTLEQLRTADGVTKLAAETGNVELKALLEAEAVADRISEGYSVHGVFVTSVPAGAEAVSFASDRDGLDLCDGKYLDDNWVASGESPPVEAERLLNLDGLGMIQYKTPEAEVLVASLRATELVTLDGIKNRELFGWNVREALGRTKVNRLIAEGIRHADEHKNFMLYHNGLTILVGALDFDEVADTVTIDRYNVVNGAQSLVTLDENSGDITDELRILVRLVKLPPEHPLTGLITRNSNNQNAISARDLQSNSRIQRRLQSEFEAMFAGDLGYEIKRGESLGATRVISNVEAGKLLLAFDLAQPYACHQAYRLFDDLHAEIFGRPVVDARRIAGLAVMMDAVVDCLPGLSNHLLANYQLTRYMLLYLVRRAIEAGTDGEQSLIDLGSVLDRYGPKALGLATSEVCGDLIVDLNAELAEREAKDELFDYKRDLKSPSAVRLLASQIIPMYEKMLKRDRVDSFMRIVEAQKA